MPLRKVPLVVVKGTTFEASVRLRFRGALVDTTGWAVRMTFETGTGVEVLTLSEATELDYDTASVVVEGTDGLRVIVPASITGTWPVGMTGAHGLLARSTEGRVLQVLRGSWSVEDPIARFS